MFDRWGELVVRARFTVIAVMVAALLGLAGYGLSLNDHLSQSGWDDPGSQSVTAAKLADGTFGRDTNGDVLALITAPEGKTVDDPEFTAAVTAGLNSWVADNPDQVLKLNGAYWRTDSAPALPALADDSKQHGVASLAIAGDNDTEIANNFRDVKDALQIDGVDVQLAGLQPVTGSLNDTMANDIKRMEILAIPAVGILLFFVFGGVIAAALPLITGGLTVVAANGIVRLITNFTEVNTFVAPVVSLIGLGLAIDYGLFMVSRFREELAEGYETAAAVRRTVVTSGRTVVFSATMVITSLGGLLLFPQGFLKSVAYGAIATVSLAALTSVTVLPAILAILGRRIDKFGMKKFGQIQSNEQVENSFIGRLTRWVMLNPMKVTIPTVIGLLLLIMPLTGIKFGGINETYLPPGHETRAAQAQFDELFPGQRTEPVKLVIRGAEGGDLNQIIQTGSAAPGLVEKFTIEGPAKDGVRVLKAGLVDRNATADTIDYLHSASWPDGVEVYVGGTPAIEQDSIAALLETLPLMIVFVVVLTTILMFLAFGSLVLPIKAALMSALGLGSTLGILTWIFIDGHGASLLNFTPGPIMSPVLVLIIAIIYGLSTDYEVFLLSRMVEARSQGASTTESIRIGTSHTGRIITAAALILIVVTGAFAFSELVMMKYISYGMIAALIIDATVIRMFLVPAVMKLLGDDCWWAPEWMKRIQEKVGLAEPILPDELMPDDVPELITVGMFGPSTITATGSHRFPKGMFGDAEGANDMMTQPMPTIAAPRPASEQRRTRDLPPPQRRSHGRPPAAREPGQPGVAQAPRGDALPPRRGDQVSAPMRRGRPPVPPQQAPGQQGAGQQGPGQPPLPTRAMPASGNPAGPLPRRGAAGPQQPVSPRQQGPAQPPREQPQTAAMPPLPRRQRGSVPPPLPRTDVRPQTPGNTGENVQEGTGRPAPAPAQGQSPGPQAQAAQPGAHAPHTPGRDPQAIESWLSQMRRAPSPSGRNPDGPRQPEARTPNDPAANNAAQNNPAQNNPPQNNPAQNDPGNRPEPPRPDDRRRPPPSRDSRGPDTQGRRRLNDDDDQTISVSELIARQRRP
ncbi:MMPL family transporter [Rhodococcus sp. NPDC060090]|uniref:MMPL family transporter n=1 Tax=Rhodococcus sp. NPDC060090 TaxID=3347056 RepID=UPI00364EA8F4